LGKGLAGNLKVPEVSSLPCYFFGQNAPQELNCSLFEEAINRNEKTTETELEESRQWHPPIGLRVLN
jgi:hypothetical protein